MSLTRSSKLFKGIRFRLTVVYSTLFGLFICIFAYIITNQYFQSDRKDYDASLLNYAIDIAEHLEIDERGLKINFHLPKSEGRKAFPFIINETYYAIREYKGTVIAKSAEFPFKEIPFNPSLPLKADYTHRFLQFESKGAIYRAVNLKITNEKSKEMILQVATPFDTFVDREREQLFVTTLTVPLLIILSSFISYLIAGNALSPIKQLTDTANSLAAKNLSQRVPEFDTGDEVEELSKTLNHLLERLEKSFRAQENFVANASHQLNTPLAIIKGELDLLESKSRTDEERQRFQKSLREEVERLIDLVKNLLLVSRVESGQESFVFYPLRLDDLLLGVTSRLGHKAKQKNLTMRFNIEDSLSEFVVKGEKQLLDSLFENLLDNAIKYSPDGTTIELTMKGTDLKPEVWIRDEGPGINDEDLETVMTKRFTRGKSINLPGSGIGLNIAHQIAAFHHAIIEYERLPKGSLFKVIFS